MTRVRRLVTWLRRALLALLLLAALLVAAGWLLLQASGLTPAQVLDEVDHRLQSDRPAMQWAGPPLTLLRQTLDAPSATERKAALGAAPPPPTRWPAVAAAEPPEPGARVLRVGPQEAVKTLAEAARLAKDGDVVEIVAGDYSAPQAVWPQRRLSIRSVGGNARLLAQGRVAEGKAIWVFRGGKISIQGIAFIGARAADRNGAGIRMERGELTVRNSLFWDSDAGILTNGGPGHEADVLRVESSEFGHLGHGDGLSHAIYAGEIGLLRISHSYLHHGRVGHLIKSRAARSHIEYNRITDEAEGRSSYEIDLPNGGIAVLVGNLIQQGRQAENGTLVSYGAEGYRQPVNRLYLVNNTLVNDHPHGGAFLRAFPGATSVVVVNNLLLGRGRLHGDESLSEGNNPRLEAKDFVAPTQFDYRLRSTAASAALQWLTPALARVGDADLIPQAEYLHPRTLRPLAGSVRLPGAFQETVEAP